MNRNIKPLLDVLPGTNKKIVNISSKDPGTIITILNQLSIPEDTVVLTNSDVWRYFSNEANIFNHPALVNKNVFMQTLEYNNTKVDNLHWKISYPIFYWSRTISSINFKLLNANLPYGFSCLNNNAGVLHRLILGYNFYKNNLLGSIIFSQNDYNSWWVNKLPAPDIINTLPDFQGYLDLLPIRAIESTSQVKNFVNDHSINNLAYNNAYCNIVTESESEEYPYGRNINLPVVTEKSYKPFRSGQIPLILGARGHIAYLKGLGFEMLEDLLPDGYDDMTILKKIDSIVTIVSKGRDYIEDFYFSHRKEIEHNYKLVNSNRVENLILQRIKEMFND